MAVKSRTDFDKSNYGIIENEPKQIDKIEKQECG